MLRQSESALAARNQELASEKNELDQELESKNLQIGELELASAPQRTRGRLYRVSTK